MVNKTIYAGVTCLIPECGRDAISRGLCRRCYQTARKRMEEGKTTEQELINANLLKPTTWSQTPVAKALKMLSNRPAMAASESH